MRIAVVERRTEVPERFRRVSAEALADLGHDVTLVRDGDLRLDECDLVWLAGSAAWFPRTTRTLARASASRPPTLFWQTEPLPLPAAAGVRPVRLHARELAKVVLRDVRRADPRSNFRALRALVRRGLPDALVVSTLERKEFLAEQGIEAEFAPLGYHPALGRDLGLERDIDVLFLGSLDVPRRKRILRSLRAAGLNVLALGSWSDPALWGDERTRLLNRTRVLLNLPRHPGLLSGYRMIIGMANRALVVAEPIYQPAPYRPGVHYVSAPLAEIPYIVNDVLEDEERRRAITDAAYDFVTTELTLERSVRTMLALVEPA